MVLRRFSWGWLVRREGKCLVLMQLSYCLNPMRRVIRAAARTLVQAESL